MNSPLETLRDSIALPSLVMRYAHAVCLARSAEELLSLCRDTPDNGPLESIHARIGRRHFRDLQHIAKQYLRDHL